MNFLFLNSARDWGGNEKWTFLASQALADEHNVCLAYRRDIVGQRFRIEKHKLPFVNAVDPYTVYRLVDLIREKKIELLIPTKRKDYVLAGLASRICGIKNVLRLGIVRSLGGNPYYNLVYNKMADGIIVNAQPIKKILLQSKFMPADQIRVIYNGLDLDKLKSHLESYPGIEKPYPFLITAMGRITKRKGYDFLIPGLARFLNRSNAPNAGLVIIGDGPQRSSLQRLIQKSGLQDRVIFTGFVDNPYPYLVMSDVFVMTSVNEGISNALLEAMFLNTAVITTRSGGSTDIIHPNQNGLLLDYGDVELLSGQLTALYADSELRGCLAAAGHRTVEKTFSLTKMKDEIVEFCENILSGRV